MINEISQQHNNLKLTTVMISDLTFNPVIQSVRRIPISSTLSSCPAVIYHFSNKINLFPCPLYWLGVFRQTCHISQKTTTQWRRLHLYSGSTSALPSRCQIFSMCTLSIKANSWIGLQYFLNYFNDLDIGQWGARGEDSELIVLISPDDHLCVRGGE